VIHSFLLIGQSNMAGRGFVDEVEPIHNEHIKVLRNGRWQQMYVPVNCDRSFSGVSLAESFADAYQKEHGVDVGLIPCADGGTSLEQWKEGGLLYDHAVLQARLAERTSTIAGVLWHQGEGDCSDEKSHSYAERFEILLYALRRDLCLTDVPILIGGLGDYLSRFESINIKTYYPIVNKQLQHISKNHKGVGFVSAEGLESNSDNLHFNAQSLREFGLRYYEEFKKLENRKKIFQEKPCEDDALRNTALENR